MWKENPLSESRDLLIHLPLSRNNIILPGLFTSVMARNLEIKSVRRGSLILFYFLCCRFMISMGRSFVLLPPIST